MRLMKKIDGLLARFRPASPARRRRIRVALSLAAECLENKQLLAVDLVAPIAPQSLTGTRAPLEINLGAAFRLAETLGTVIKVDTNAALPQPSFYLELFDTLGSGRNRTTPATAQNFLRYVNDGSFDRSIIHRSGGGLMQSGGYTAPSGNAVLPDTSPNPNGYPVTIASKGSITDEIGNANLRGTIAMAKTLNASQQPIAGSAASQWFVNVVDNRDLDSQYAAFGRVLGDGMRTIDVMATVTPFEADQYYDEAFGKLPLWEVPTDQNIRPANFLTFTRMSRVAADDLIGFTATTSNSSLVRAEVSGETLVISRAGEAAGTATVRVRASSVFDASDFRDFELTVTVPELARTTVEQVGNVTLAYDIDGRIFAGGTRITLSGNHVDFNAYNSAGWRAVAAESINGVNTLVWRHTSGNLHFWRFSNSWAQQAGEGWQAPGSSEFNATEVAFGMDFNADGVIGAALTDIETAGSVKLSRDAAGRLFAGGTMITLGGNPVDFNAMNAAGWRAMAAENINGVNSLAWRHSSGNLHFWRLSGTWEQQSSDGWQGPRSNALRASERAFDTDFNGDSIIGAPHTVIESVGSVTLSYDDAGRLHAGGTRVTLGGNPVDFNAMVASGWQAVAAERINGVNTIAWRHSSRNLHFWRMSGSWAQMSSDGWQGPRSADAQASELAFGMDFNLNGNIGR